MLVNSGDRGTQNKKDTEMIKCSECGLELPVDDLRRQMAHMDKFHPEVVARRQAEAERLMGWANDD